MRRACIFLMLLTLLPLCAGCAAADEGAGTQLIALNIGKADCLLLQTQGKAYLIDTGWERTSAAMPMPPAPTKYALGFILFIISVTVVRGGAPVCYCVFGLFG